MVIASHIILTGYGHWLPNDPRGSMSPRVWSRGLRELAEPHYGPKQQQPSIRELRTFHQRAADKLAHPPLWFNAAYRQAIAEAFHTVMQHHGYTCFACAIVTNHAHLIIRRHREKAREMIHRLKTESAARLRAEPDIPDEHPIWSDDPYPKFLHTPADVRRTIAYVNNIFAKSKLPPQQYSFITPYTGEWSGKRCAERGVNSEK